MRVFKMQYGDRHGRPAVARKYYLEFRFRGRTHRLAAFKDRAASEAFGRRIDRLIAHRLAGEQPDPALVRWMQDVPVKTLDRLAKIGLVSRERVAALKPLADHLADFRQTLLDQGDTARHVKAVVRRVEIVLDGIGAEFWRDITGAAVERYLAQRRADGLSIQTSNHYTTQFKQFCMWMVREGRAATSPVTHLKRLNAAPDRRVIRRALTLDEQRRLIETTMEGVSWWNMTGPARALLYRLALETGFRANELRSLTPVSFDLDGTEPTVTVQAAYSKRRRQDVQPISVRLAADLKAYLAGRDPLSPAFDMPAAPAKMIKADYVAAGIPVKDASGRVVDFHALRHTFITSLARGGVHPKVAQDLARHSTITLTMDRYAHSLIEERRRALDALPDLSGKVDEKMATGSASRTA